MSTQFCLPAQLLGPLPSHLRDPHPDHSHRQRRSRMWRVLAAVVLGTLLTACGGGNDNPAPAPASGQVASGTDSPATPSGGDTTPAGGTTTPAGGSTTPAGGTTTPTGGTTTPAVAAPAITQQPASASVTAGQTASFGVAATGDSLQYQWRKNDADISGANAAAYTTAQTAAGDNGSRFTVVVSNSAGSVASDAATLTVNAVAVGGGPGKMSMSLSYDSALVSRADGTVWGWGFVQTTTDTTDHLSPVAMPGLAGITQVAVTMGGGENFALKSDGTLLSWGSHDENGIQGNGARLTPHSLPNATTVVGLDHVVQVSAGGSFAIALKDTGEVYAWGNNDFGTLGQPQTVFPWSGTPLKVPGIAGAKKLVAGYYGSLALLNDGTVMQWGYVASGLQTADVLAVHATPGLTDIVDIAAGNAFWAALRSDGTVVVMGDFGSAQSGPIYTVPTPAAGLTGVKAIAATNQSMMALMNDGTVMAWGYNVEGEVGNGSTAGFVATPQQVTGLTGVIQIAGGGRGTCLALRSDGTVAAWGSNTWGMVGVGTFLPEYRTPQTIPGLNLLTP